MNWFQNKSSNISQCGVRCLYLAGLRLFGKSIHPTDHELLKRHGNTAFGLFSFLIHCRLLTDARYDVEEIVDLLVHSCGDDLDLREGIGH